MVQIVVRRIVLALLLVWAVGSWLVAASFLWTPQGTVGVRSDYGGEIAAVDPDSPAGRAGIAAGDRIVLDRTPFASRPLLVGITTPMAPGTVVPFCVRHGSAERNVSLVAVPARTGPGERFSLLMGLASSAIFIIVGAGLILLRPSLVTWGFGLFCLLANPIVPALSRFPSAWAHLWYVLTYDVIQNVGIVGLLVFALNFPSALHRPWRSVLRNLLWPIFIVLAGWTFAIDFAICILARPMRVENVSLQIAFGVMTVVAIALITETYFKGPMVNRPRLSWVLVGFYVGLVFNFIGNLLLYTANVALPGWTDNVLIATELTLPLAVAYAVVRHRVIDVDFFFSRALVYAIFTSVLVMLFALSDWVFDRLLSNFRLSIVLDAMISIGVALTFDRAHAILERGLDAVIFRGRRIGADRLARTAQALRFITSAPALDETLVRESHEALNVKAIALFRLEGTGYHRVADAGWSDAACTELSPDDRLVVEHLAREGALHVADIPWQRADAPQGADRPILSLPVRCSSTLAGILLCSLKPHGEQLDPEETSWLLAFANAAAIAYERLAAERLREHSRSLEMEVAILNGRLEEARKA